MMLTAQHSSRLSTSNCQNKCFSHLRYFFRTWNQIHPNIPCLGLCSSSPDKQQRPMSPEERTEPWDQIALNYRFAKSISECP
jgi:hypothetical protein